MKRIMSILIACLALTMLTVGFASAATITVRADPWMPYDGDAKSGELGYMIEVAKEIFAAEGHEIDYKNMPWTRCLDAVKKGTYDAVVGADESEAGGFVFPSESFGVNQNGFFVKKGSSWKYTGIDSVKQIRLGIIDGYGYDTKLDNYFEETGKSKKIFVANGDDALSKLIKMLKTGRIDVVIENVNVMKHTLQEQQLSNVIVNVGLSEELTDLYMPFSPAKESSKEYARIFDEGIVKLRNSGKLQEIMSRYGLKDWK